MHGLSVKVSCYAGYRGEETPRRVQLGDHEIDIAEILRRWNTPEHRYFECRDARGVVHVLRHQPARDRWELTASRPPGECETQVH